MTQAFLVGRLEKTGTKAPMDLDTRPDHSPTDFIRLHGLPSYADQALTHREKLAGDFLTLCASVALRFIGARTLLTSSPYSLLGPAVQCCLAGRDSPFIARHCAIVTVLPQCAPATLAVLLKR